MSTSPEGDFFSAFWQKLLVAIVMVILGKFWKQFIVLKRKSQFKLLE